MHLPKLRYVMSDRDRSGAVRYYFRKRGQRKIRLPGRPGDPDFMSAYATALQEATAAGSAICHGSLRWLAAQYFASGEYARLSDITRKRRRAEIEAVCQEPVDTNAADGDRIGDLPAHRLSAKHIRLIRDRRADRIEAANFRVKALRALFKWARDDADLTEANPAAEVPFLHNASEGFHTWTVEEVRQYEDHWPLGTRQRVALAVLLFTGARRADAAMLGRQHIRMIDDDSGISQRWLFWTIGKGRNRKIREAAVPMLPELSEAIEAGPTGDLTFICSSRGTPYTPESLGNAVRKWCNAAGLPHCSAHGLRKAGACIAAENGATEAQLMAIFGWDDAKQAARYTRAARRRHLAGAAVHLLSRRNER